MNFFSSFASIRSYWYHSLVLSIEMFKSVSGVENCSYESSNELNEDHYSDRAWCTLLAYKKRKKCGIVVRVDMEYGSSGDAEQHRNQRRDSNAFPLRQIADLSFICCCSGFMHVRASSLKSVQRKNRRISPIKATHSYVLLLVNRHEQWLIEHVSSISLCCNFCL